MIKLYQTKFELCSKLSKTRKSSINLEIMFQTLFLRAIQLDAQVKCIISTIKLDAQAKFLITRLISYAKGLN